MLGSLIGASEALKDRAVNLQWIAHDVVFGLCAEFLQSGVSVILDLNMGHAFQWQQLDALRQGNRALIWIPIVLDCPRDICMERIGQRYVLAPDLFASPDVYTTVPHIKGVWTFLEQLHRPDTYIVDAAQAEDKVYADIKQFVNLQR